MSSHSDCTNTLANGSPLPSLRDPPTQARATQVPDSDSKELTPSHQVISAQSESHRRTFYTATIDILPNEVLLDIFDHIRRSKPDFESSHIPVWKWHPLVHVCRRWRQIVFASSRRLNIQLLCTNGTPVRKNLACWPAFPIVVHYNTFEDLSHKDEGNVIAALKHRSRIRQIKLTVSSSVWSRIATVMLEPFPALTSLSVCSWPRDVPLLLPVKFLGGSAPSLQQIRLQGFPTITLPYLITHTNDLIKLDLIECNTHLTSCLSPAGLVVCLASLPRLKNLSITLPSFWTRTSNPDRWKDSLPANTRIVLPALTSFAFNGACTYLEDLMTKIDTPGLDSLDIKFWDSRDYRIPQLSDFINRTALKPFRFDDAKLSFVGGDMATIDLKDGLDLPPLSIEIPLCRGRNHQVWCLAQVLRQTSATLSNVFRLEIVAESCDEEDGDMRNVDWSKLLCPFTAVQTLHVYADSEFVENIARALEDTLAEPDNKVLPALNLLYVEGVGVTAESIVLPGRNCTITVRCQEPDSEASDLDLEDD